MLRRLLAVVFAVFVLLVAMQLRGDGDDGRAAPLAGGRPDGSAGDNGYEVFDDDEVALLCIEDLRALCREGLDLFGFTVRIEPAWTTVDRLRDGGELGADAWLTVQPFPEIASPAGGGGLEEPLGRPTAVVARSPFVAVGPAAGIADVDAACPDAAVLLSCIAGPGRSGPTVARHPGASALGSLALATLVPEIRSDPAVPPRADAGVADAVQAFVAATRRSQAPLEDALRIGGSAAAFTVEAELLEELQRLDYDLRDTAQERFGVRYPLDVRAAEIVVVPVPRFPRPRDLQSLFLTSAAGYAFERAGWIAEARESYLHDGPLFVDRPVVRTDLRWDPELVDAVRRVAAP